MRPILLWTLGATGVLTAAALWLDDKPATLVAALDRTVRNLPEQATAMPASAAGPVHALPSVLEPVQVEPARRDIFVPVEPPAPKVVAPVQAPPPPPPPPPAPTAPAMTWRYLGSMLTPSGQRLVMLARADSSITIEVGTRLEEGYVVEAIGSDAVRLVYPPLGTTVDIPIPPAPPPTR